MIGIFGERELLTDQYRCGSMWVPIITILLRNKRSSFSHLVVSAGSILDNGRV